MKNLRIYIFLIVLTACSTGTNEVKEKNEISIKTIQYIKELGLLDKNEEVLFFSTSLNYKVSGNIVTERRLASYWLNNSADDYISSAYYYEIDDIFFKAKDGFEFSSYFKVNLKNGKNFNVYFSGEKEELQRIYYNVLRLHRGILKSQSVKIKKNALRNTRKTFHYE